MNNKIKVTKQLTVGVIILLTLPTLTFGAFNPSTPNSAYNLTIGNIIDAIFSILWPIAVAFFIIMFIIAGFMFATSQGNPEGVKRARDAVIWGMIGVIVALLSFSIVFIIRNAFPGI